MKETRKVKITYLSMSWLVAVMTEDEKNRMSFLAESQLHMGYNTAARPPIMLESFS
jgi:hypothetical protein